MKVSVVIPSYNGAHKLPILIHALEKQSFKDFEVIFVLDGSKDNSNKIILTNSKFLTYKIAEFENGGRSKARNRGVNLAKGELIIFFDDDMEPLPDCIEQHWAFHQRSIENILVAGVQRDVAQNSDIQRYKTIICANWEKTLAQNSLKQSIEKVFLSSANFSIPKNLFLQLNGFDERLTDAEDYELGIRAISQGYSLYYLPQAIGLHYDLITCKSYIKRLRQYANAHKKVQEINPLAKMDLASPTSVSGIKYYVYKALAQGFFVKLIDGFNVFLILPQSIRYKFYDILIHSLGNLFPNKKLD